MTGGLSSAIKTRARRPINETRREPSLSPVAAICCAAGLGLLVCSLADALSRATLAPTPLLYWAGVLLLCLPIFYRLTDTAASTSERLFLVCLLGLGLYLVKVFRDAPSFTFSDELVHAFNANQIADHHHLFRENPILEVTPSYPGLEGATSALMKLTGASAYTCGVILVGAARLLLVSSMFLLFQRVGGSARAAGLGVAIYAGNFNFLYWGAQFSYESLALPLLLLVMMALAEREAAPREALRAWALPVILGIAAIVVTHHLSSYALVLVLAALALASWYVKRSWSPPNPWPFAVFAGALALAWLFVVASSTIGYLSPVLSHAVTAVVHTISGEQPPRSLFQGTSSAIPATPLAAKAVALLGVLALLAGLPFGLRHFWRSQRKVPFALLFAIAAVGFFGTLALRLSPAAWETGNRAGEFLFIGLAFLLSWVLVEALKRRRGRWVRFAAAASIALIVIGGAIAGWPWDSQLAKPLQISADGKTLPSPPLSVAEWSASHLKDGRFAAQTADAGLLLYPGGKFAKAGVSPDIEDLLDAENLEPWQLPLLRENNLGYIVADRRDLSSDTLRGYYFTRSEEPEELLPQSVSRKFNRIPHVSRLYTNGDITVFGLGGKP